MGCGLLPSLPPQGVTLGSVQLFYVSHFSLQQSKTPVGAGIQDDQSLSCSLEEQYLHNGCSGVSPQILLLGPQPLRIICGLKEQVSLVLQS